MHTCTVGGKHGHDSALNTQLTWHWPACVLCVGFEARKVRMPTLSSQPPVPASSLSPPLSLPQSLAPLARLSCHPAATMPGLRRRLSVCMPLCRRHCPAAATQPAFSAAAPPPSHAPSTAATQPTSSQPYAVAQHTLTLLPSPPCPPSPSPSRPVGAQPSVLLLSVFLGPPPNDSPHHSCNEC